MSGPTETAAVRREEPTDVAATSLRLLTRADLDGLIPTALLTAAEDYLLAERLRRPAAAGNRLAAHVEGFRGDYEVTVRLLEAGIESTCTCGKRQPCPHAAALLLAWTVRRPWFTDLDELLAPLASLPATHLIPLLGEAVLEPQDRISPLVRGAGLLHLLDAAAGRWLSEDEVAARVRGLASRWDQALAQAADGDPSAATDVILDLASQAAALARRSQDSQGLLTRFLAACVTQVGALASAPGLSRADRLGAAARLVELLVAGPAEAGAAAVSSLAALVGADSDLTDWVRAKLLEGMWQLESCRMRGEGPAPAVRQAALAQALAAVLGAGERDADLADLLAPFSHLWQAAVRRIEALRRLGRTEVALAAARGALAGAGGQSAVDLHQLAGELLVDLGRPGEAAPHLLASYLGRPNPSTLGVLRRAAEAAGIWDQVRCEVALPEGGTAGPRA